MKLVLLSDLKDYIGLPSTETAKDNLLNAIIEGVSRFFESEIHRNLELQEYTEIIDGDDSDTIILKQFPVTEVDYIKIDNAEIDLETEQAYPISLYIDKESGILERSSGWNGGFKNIEVKYSAGFTLPGEESGADYTLPEDIILAAKRLSARVYEKRTAEGISSAENISYKDFVDEDIKSTIGSYYKFR
jgi:hypothetical protein